DGALYGSLKSEEREAAAGSVTDPNRFRHSRLWWSMSPSGRSPAPLSVHGIRGWGRPAAGDGGYLGGCHRISTPFQYAGQGSHHGTLQALRGYHLETAFDHRRCAMGSPSRDTRVVISAGLQGKSARAAGGN